MMEIIMPFVAALIGSFIGAYSNEHFSEIFLKRRKRREVKSQLIKYTIQFFRVLTRYIDNQNSSEIHTVRMRKLAEKKLNPDITDKERAKVDHNVKGMFDYVERITNEGRLVFRELTDIESTIYSLEVDVSYYYPKHEYRQLKKVIEELSFELANENILIRGYEALPYEEIYRYQTSEFLKIRANLMKETNRRKDYFVDQINEILS